MSRIPITRLGWHPPAVDAGDSTQRDQAGARNIVPVIDYRGSDPAARAGNVAVVGSDPAVVVGSQP
jgi:hypothetical protein